VNTPFDNTPRKMEKRNRDTEQAAYNNNYERRTVSETRTNPNVRQRRGTGGAPIQ